MEGYVGEIRLFGGMFAPENWAYCQGQALSITQYQPLYAVIGITYGGDGHTSFNLPNLCGRTAIGAGQGAGLSLRHLGDKIGSETVPVTIDQLPAHNHTSNVNLTGKVRCNDQLSDHSSPVSNTLAVFKEDRNAFNTQAPDADMHDNTVAVSGTVQLANTGGNQAHSNIQPSLGLNYIICLDGTYPPHS